MSFTNSSSAGAPMCDINTTPLVDVMLVLLIAKQEIWILEFTMAATTISWCDL